MPAHDTSKMCTYQDALKTRDWFNANNIDQGVSKDPYDAWADVPQVQPVAAETVASWLLDTNGGSTGISAWMIQDRIAKYGNDVAVQMTKDELKKP